MPLLIDSCCYHRDLNQLFAYIKTCNITHLSSYFSDGVFNNSIGQNTLEVVSDYCYYDSFTIKGKGKYVGPTVGESANNSPAYDGSFRHMESNCIK